MKTIFSMLLILIVLSSCKKEPIKDLGTDTVAPDTYGNRVGKYSVKKHTVIFSMSTGTTSTTTFDTISIYRDTDFFNYQFGYVLIFGESHSLYLDGTIEYGSWDGRLFSDSLYLHKHEGGLGVWGDYTYTGHRISEIP